MASAANKGIAKSTVVICALTVLALAYALSLFMYGGFRAAQTVEYADKVLSPVNEDVLAHQAAQRALLSEAPRWLDQEQGRACIPIEDAKNRLVEEDAASGHVD